MQSSGPRAPIPPPLRRSLTPNSDLSASQWLWPAETLTSRSRGLGQLPSRSCGGGAPSLLNPMPYRIGAAVATGLVILSLYWM